MSLGELDFSLCFIQLSTSHDVLCAVLGLVTQSCLTLSNPMDCSQATLSMGILQARILEWVAMCSAR